MILLGIDTGGTFTDFVLWRDGRVRIHKVLSTPAAPEQAILQGIRELGLTGELSDNMLIVHGSTVATNTVLEGKGARTVLITNRGFGDMLTIGRQARRELYNLQPKPVAPPVPKALCLETGGRLSAQGELIEALTDADISALVNAVEQLKPQAVAINLLFSFLNDEAEKRIEAAMPEHLFVSRSSKVLPETKEYERGITAWLNACVGPVVQGYLRRLLKGINETIHTYKDDALNVSVMQSAGGTIDAAQAADQAVQMLLSGPAGGLAGARYAAACSGEYRLLTFDMGGTSTDVALIDRDLALTSEGNVGGYPVGVPMVDMHTIGAGGGSIAYIDEGGLLQVGPQSAGAQPGPACYARGGVRATVTDANLVLGRLPVNAFLGGSMRLDEDAARRAIQPLAERLSLSIEQTAQGIIQVANEHMARALRVMSVQRGINPKPLCLVSFGGAGGLHVCALAESMSMRRALVPVQAGVLSALGMLVAPRARYLSRSMGYATQAAVDAQIEEFFTHMIEHAQTELEKEGVHRTQMQVMCSMDARYQGQSYCLTIPWQNVTLTLEAFHAAHEKRYGHRLSLAVEWVTARVRVSGQSHDQPIAGTAIAEQGSMLREEVVRMFGVSQPVKVIPRHLLSGGKIYEGPLLITEAVATTYIEPGWQICADDVGNLLLSK